VCVCVLCVCVCCVCVCVCVCVCARARVFVLFVRFVRFVRFVHFVHFVRFVRFVYFVCFVRVVCRVVLCYVVCCVFCVVCVFCVLCVVCAPACSRTFVHACAGPIRSSTIDYTDGTSIQFARREEPKIFTDDQGRMLAMFNAVAVARNAATRAPTSNQSQCSVGRVAVGMDLPGHDMATFAQNNSATAAACGELCCAHSKPNAAGAACRAFVFAVGSHDYMTCKKDEPCCFLKSAVPQGTPSTLPQIASGSIAVPPTPAPHPSASSYVMSQGIAN
jgi:hypothetical protein